MKFEIKLSEIWRKNGSFIEKFGQEQLEKCTQKCAIAKIVQNCACKNNWNDALAKNKCTYDKCAILLNSIKNLKNYFFFLFLEEKLQR